MHEKWISKLEHCRKRVGNEANVELDIETSGDIGRNIEGSRDVWLDIEESRDVGLDNEGSRDVGLEIIKYCNQ